MNTNTPLATDNFKALARRHGTTVAAIRDMARDLGLSFTYSPERHTWILDEKWWVIIDFNNHLTDTL